MAKVRLGILAGAASGSLGSTVFSHNRGGVYVRNRTVPVKVTSEIALNTKAYLSEVSQGWGGLSENARAAWNSWADVNPFTDRLGDKRILTGHQAYIKLSTRLRRSGDSVRGNPPVATPPGSVSSFSLAASEGGGTVTATYADLPADMKPWLYLCQVDSPGIVYVENLLRLVSIGAADEASPWDVASDFIDRFGNLIEGNIIHGALFVYDPENGQLSPRLTASCTIAA